MVQTICDLKAELKAKGIKGYSGKKKAELIAMLRPAPLSASGSARRVKTKDKSLEFAKEFIKKWDTDLKATGTMVANKNIAERKEYNKQAVIVKASLEDERTAIYTKLKAKAKSNARYIKLGHEINNIGEYTFGKGAQAYEDAHKN